jgi:hypothetical protein
MVWPYGNHVPINQAEQRSPEPVPLEEGLSRFIYLLHLTSRVESEDAMQQTKLPSGFHFHISHTCTACSENMRHITHLSFSLSLLSNNCRKLFSASLFCHRQSSLAPDFASPLRKFPQPPHHNISFPPPHSHSCRTDPPPRMLFLSPPSLPS